MNPKMFNLDGKVAVVTGGSGALGASMCKGLAAAGATVVVIARNEQNIKAVTDAIEQDGGKALGISADVLDSEAMKDASKQIIDTYGQLDILVNGAGGNKAEATSMPGQRNFFDLPQDALCWVFV